MILSKNKLTGKSQERKLEKNDINLQLDDFQKYSEKAVQNWNCCTRHTIENN